VSKDVDKFIRDTLSPLRAEVPNDIQEEVDTQRIIREANKDKNKDGHSSDKILPIILKRKLHDK
jgi:hypothetical protein|tara:strand:+ start:448 stop:639 length:192 start_codon:yes stop_codon:yes gene_type:complete